MRKITIIAGLALLTWSCNQKQTTVNQELESGEDIELVETPKEVEFHKILSAEAYSLEIKDKDIQLLDVRTAEEYADGNIAGSQHVDFEDKEALYQTLENLDKTQPVYIYCRTGNKSGQTADIMKEMGFFQVIDLDGGYQEGM